MKQEMVYPQYRKYKNGKNFFKIVSAEVFEEIQVMGSRYTLQLFTSKILPDRNFIYDMTFDFRANWEEISEAEYVEIKEKVS
ncbi:MAG: hypothetical protein ACHQRM_10990 [Bacteroidia bacterium]